MRPTTYHLYTYSVHSKGGGGNLLTGPSNNKLMIHGDTEIIGWWKAYFSPQEGGGAKNLFRMIPDYVNPFRGGTEIEIEGYYFWGRTDGLTNRQSET